MGPDGGIGETTPAPGLRDPGVVGERVEVRTPGGDTRGVLHASENARGAAVLVSGAGGGIEGPSGVYEDLAERLRADGATALRLDYRKPNDLAECTRDVLAALNTPALLGAGRVVLVGWSFGGAVVVRAGRASERVVGVATVATQTYGAESVGALSPAKSLLLIHGTADQTLPADLSRYLYREAGEPKELVLYPGDGHGIQRHRREMLEYLHGWCRRLLLDRGGA